MAETLTIQLKLAEPALVLIPAPVSEAQIKFSDVIKGGDGAAGPAGKDGIDGQDGQYPPTEQIPGFTVDLLSHYNPESIANG